MFKGEDIICISTIDWDFNWQGHQEIMSAFAKNGNRVLFVENTGIRAPRLRDLPRLKKRLANWLKGTRGIRQEAENLYVFSPLVVPFPYMKLARWFNRKIILSTIRTWMRVIGFKEPIIWTFLPTGLSIDVIENIASKLVVYYCIADFYSLVKEPRKIRASEEKLLEHCDVVFAQGEMLKARCLKKNNNVWIFPFGVKEELFLSALNVPQEPADMRAIAHPRIGYVGGIHKHVDFALLEHAAREHPEWSFVMVGPLQEDVAALKRHQNIFFLGKKPHAEIPHYIAGFDVCTIPYKTKGYLETVYPTKLNEYLIMGKPVCSTALEELKREAMQGVLYLSGSYEGFSKTLAQALSEKDTPSLIEKRKEFARNNGWTKRIEEMSSIMSEAIRKKQIILQKDWRVRFAKMYRNYRRIWVKPALLLALIYVLVYKTPFMWIVASPLKVSMPPRQAEAIVVRAGGVGESGEAGQGYEERVEYAVDLYKKGYAPKMIFSSGYVYLFNETEVMKALAVEIGARKDDIILESEAVNTYQNIKNTSDIIHRQHWREVLLVSSPYNMKRAMLVAHKIAGDITMVPTPIPRSLFFGDGTSITNAQIRAIIHEYLGIVYYWWKGYI
jgi:uncharacterized SAM-binding protein YcdF (DUF218 family)/glycosyltransferase involved in cell wall biosynthesis